MHIAMLQDQWWPRTGGGAVHVRDLSIALARHCGHTVDIYTRAYVDDGGTTHRGTETYAHGAVTVYRTGPVTAFYNPVGRLLSTVTPIPTLTRRDYDVIHGHTFTPSITTKLGAAVARVPSVFTVHGTAIPSGVGYAEGTGSGVKRWLERLLVLHADFNHVVSVNEEHIELLREYHDSVSYIPNGVDLDRFTADRTSGQNKSFTVLFLGRLAPKKRVSDLIDALSYLDDTTDVELIIVGNGPLRDDLETLATEREVADLVSFEGRVSDDVIPDYYADADLFVLPSVWEGHPLTLLEAWAASLPVVTTAVEGIREFVDHCETGYLVDAERPEQLAEAIEYVRTHPDEARAWGENGRSRVASHYTWRAVAERTESLYHSLVE